jgi:hypothetical protein
VLICFSDTTVAFHIDPNPRVDIIPGPDLTKEEAREYLTANNGPMEDALVELILENLGTRVFDLFNMQRILRSQMKDREEVERYLQSEIDSTVRTIPTIIKTHPKMLELLMALDHAEAKELETTKVMDIMEVTNITTLKTLITDTNLISIRAKPNMLVFRNTICQNAFEEWKKKYEEESKKRRTWFGLF